MEVALWPSYAHMEMCTHPHTHTNTHEHMYAQAYAYTCMCTQTYTHIVCTYNTHIYTFLFKMLQFENIIYIAHTGIYNWELQDSSAG